MFKLYTKLQIFNSMKNMKFKTVCLLVFCLNIATTMLGQEWNKHWPIIKTYEGKYLDEVAMPLGGIGTGTVSIGGKGDLRDWEIMNRGAIGYLPAFKLVQPTIANDHFLLYIIKNKINQQK